MNPVSWLTRKWTNFFAASPCPVTGGACRYEQSTKDPPGCVICADCGDFTFREDFR